MAKFDLRELARRGAEARVAELTAELAAIQRAFPGLRVRKRDAAAATATAPRRRRRRRKPMSSDQKKAVSIRMKKYWAARRKAKAQA